MIARFVLWGDAGQPMSQGKGIVAPLIQIGKGVEERDLCLFRAVKYSVFLLGALT